MIVVPTNPAWHLAFDALAWGSSLLLGIVLYRWRLKDAATKVAAIADSGYFVCLSVGAILGAYVSGSFALWGAGTFALAHSVLGALVGAIAGVETYKLTRGIQESTGIIFVGPFALGVGIGRWGCLFAGLEDQTFGSPANLPWSVDLGDGVARHPVQIYESAAMLIFLCLYLVALGKRWNWPTKNSFYALAIFYGLQRFVWEFLKPYPPMFGPLNLYHFLSIALVIYGVAMILRATKTHAAP